jgi:hypothetical protein
MQIAYAMLLSTKINAENFYKYSNFEAIEQNIASKLNPRDVDYIASYYQAIIAKECEGIMADRSQIPTEDKLMKYAFPLKSDAKRVRRYQETTNGGSKR